MERMMRGKNQTVLTLISRTMDDEGRWNGRVYIKRKRGLKTKQKRQFMRRVLNN